MRLSTAYMFNQSLSAILDQQSALAKTQEQVSSGKKLSKPSDDPLASVEVLNLQRESNLVDQHLRNADKAENNLLEEEGVLDNATNILQRIKELSVQGLSDTYSLSDRASIADEMTHLNNQLLFLANTRDSNGHYLFSGFSSDVQPYTSIGASYGGDSGQRNLQVGAGVRIETNDPGDQIFESNSVKTDLDSSGAADSSLTITAVGPDNVIPTTTPLDVSFNPGLGTLTVTMGATTQTVTPYVAGEVVKLSDLDVGFPDFELKLEGGLTANDTHQLTTVTTHQTIFKTISDFASALSHNAVSANDSPNNGDVLTNIAKAMDTVIDTQARIGARVNVIDHQRDVNNSFSINMARSLSDLQDLDYAEAISKLNLQSIGLQAAQQSFVKIQGLTLFNYL